MCSANLLRGDKQRDFPFVLFGQERSPWVSDDALACERKPVPVPLGKIICISCSEMLHEVRVYYSGKLGTTNNSATSQFTNEV